jgi:hypothetical protein
LSKSAQQPTPRSAIKPLPALHTAPPQRRAIEQAIGSLTSQAFTIADIRALIPSASENYITKTLNAFGNEGLIQKAFVRRRRWRLAPSWVNPGVRHQTSQRFKGRSGRP